MKISMILDDADDDADADDDDDDDDDALHDPQRLSQQTKLSAVNHAASVSELRFAFLVALNS